MRATDTVYRYGGEELAVVARGTTGPDAVLLAERLRGLVAGRTGVTASIGVITTDGDLGPDRFVEGADRALYDAKAAGGDAVRSAPVLPGIGLASPPDGAGSLQRTG